jgi:tetratricopeptide (TPR) repeat protein
VIEGPLKELNIHDVFQLLDLGRKTGVLRVTSELRQNAGVVTFERGAVIGAHITSNPHPLGELLLRAGKLREEDLSRARALQEAGDRRRLGEILVAIDAVSGRELDRSVRAQVEEVVFELMSWSEGYFSFVEGPADRSEIEAPVSIATEALLMEAARRIDEWTRIESMVPHLGVVPRLRPPENDSAAPLDLVPFEWEVLAAVDGARDLRLIADALGRSDFDVARTIYGLTSAGVVVLDSPAPATATAAPQPSGPATAQVDEHLAMGDFEAARLAAVDLIAADPERADGYLALGRTLLRLARWEEAEEALVDALHRSPTAAAPRRFLALALVAQGRFADAIESCDRWTRADGQSADERGHAVAVTRLRDAAQVLADALRERHV